MVYTQNVHLLLSFILCPLGGFTGSLLDSVLGATIQVKYFSEKEGRITEKRLSNGSVNKVISGHPLVNNDVVNFTSSFISSLLTVIVYMLLSGR